MLALLFVILTIAFGEETALTNGGDEVKLMPKGADMIITAKLDGPETGLNNTSSATSPRAAPHLNLWTEMWFDKIEELKDNETVVFAIDDLATTDFVLSSMESEVAYDAQTLATRFNYSFTLSNGAMLIISVYPNFLVRNLTGSNNISEADEAIERGSATQSPINSSALISSIGSSVQQSSPLPPVESSNASAQHLQQAHPSSSDTKLNWSPLSSDIKPSGKRNETRNTVLADGTVVPFSAVKFSIWVSNWPFANKSNTLRIGCFMSSSDSKNETGVLEGHTLHVGSGFIMSQTFAMYDGTKGAVATDVYRGELNDGVQWTFASFDKEMLYDPVFGYTSSALHILPSITTVLLILVMSVLRL
jgi:hypothetical protein